jgi:hypothetical protein
MHKAIEGPLALVEVIGWAVRQKILEVIGKVGVAQEVDFDWPRVNVTNVEAPAASEEELNGGYSR